MGWFHELRFHQMLLGLRRREMKGISSSYCCRRVMKCGRPGRALTKAESRGVHIWWRHQNRGFICVLYLRLWDVFAGLEALVSWGLKMLKNKRLGNRFLWGMPYYPVMRRFICHLIITNKVILITLSDSTIQWPYKGPLLQGGGPSKSFSPRESFYRNVISNPFFLNSFRTIEPRELHRRASISKVQTVLLACS
jgi:hypothetical protein